MRIPGLVNAHVHLELPRVPTPRGEGLLAWVRALRAGEPASRATFDHNLAAAHALGTGAVVDVSNHGFVGHLPGLYQHEFYGIDEAPVLPPAATPHTPFTTPARTIVACARMAEAAHRCWSIHVDEDPDERSFLSSKSGPWADYMRARGRDLSGFEPFPGTPVAYLDHLGVLSPRSLLVHCVLTGPDDLDTVARRGAAIALCPRSNLHITGRLPDVPAMLARGIPVCIGTDSLSSTPDLDLLGEVAVLRAHFPAVPLDTWLHALTTTPSRWLGLPSTGALEVDADDLSTLFDSPAPSRRWVS